jgi:hypothetical protein
MKKLLLAAIVIGLMIFGGWLVVKVGSESTSMELRTDRIKEDTSKAVDKVKQGVEKVGERIEQTSEAPTIEDQ